MFSKIKTECHQNKSISYDLEPGAAQQWLSPTIQIKYLFVSATAAATAAAAGCKVN